MSSTAAAGPDASVVHLGPPVAARSRAVHTIRISVDEQPPRSQLQHHDLAGTLDELAPVIPETMVGIRDRPHDEPVGVRRGRASLDLPLRSASSKITSVPSRRGAIMTTKYLVWSELALRG